MRPITMGFVAMAAGVLFTACTGGGDTGTVDPGASGTVGAGGGNVVLVNGPTITIPPGALGADTVITIAASTTAAPPGAVTGVFQFGPDGTSFTTPATVSFTVPAGTSAADVAVYWTRPGSSTQWDILPVTVSGTTARASVTHFSAGYVGAASYVPVAMARRYVVTPTGAPSFYQSDEVTQYSPPVFTRKVIASSAGYRTYTTSSYSHSGGAVYMSGAKSYALGSIENTTYSPPALIFPADTTPGATASSTSTVWSGAATSTTTRALTVNQIETVTVPAGTFQALKVSTYITGPAAQPSYYVAWWAPGVGRVKSVGYAAAAPDATTTVELLSYLPMVCTAGTCTCNDLVNSAPEVPDTWVPANLPVPAGGTLLDGTYHLTAHHFYSGPGGTAGLDGDTIKQVATLRSGVFQWTFWYNKNPADVSQGAMAFQVSGSQLVGMTVCGYQENGDIGTTSAAGFTVSGNTWSIVSSNPYYPGPGPYQEIGQEMVYTRQ